MKLSNRLASILEWIDTGVLADIGCDHGYLACQAVLENKARKAYACDVAEGPLQQARRTIAENGLEDSVFLRKQNGLLGLPEDASLAVIAGMGGTLIEEILEAWRSANPEENLEFLLSPHKDASELRSYLSGHGFHIEKERVVEDGHFYPLMKVRYEPEAEHQVLSEAECLLGKHPVMDDIRKKWLLKELKKWSAVYRNMPPEKAGPVLQKTEMIRQELQNF